MANGDPAGPLAPAMGPAVDPTWPHARWIGTLDRSRLANLPEAVPLLGGTAYTTARLLIRQGLSVLGFVELPLTNGALSRGALLRAVAQLPVPEPPLDAALPPITVATSTRNRPQYISALLNGILALDYPDFEVLVVDNASDTDATLRAVEAVDDARVRAIREPLPGTSRGRNTALLAARHDIVAFLDDDVVVDPLWLRGLAQGFARRTDVALVTAMVPTGELVSAAQGYFESRVAWRTRPSARVFHLQEPPADSPMFPFEVGDLGTGASFAIRRDFALALGGFNEALGGGAPARAGEDIELFVRVLYAGAALVHEPSATAWHRHRRDIDDLETQVGHYGRGFGAWITTVLLDPRMRQDALRLSLRGLGRTRSMAALADDVQADLGIDVAALRRRERRALLGGPYWYARSRWDRRLARPLRSR